MIARAFLKLNEVIIDKRGGRLDQLHVARDTAVVPPVRHQRRDSITPALVVDFNDKEVASVANEPRDLEVERREAPFVLTDLLAVEIDVSEIVGRTEVDEEARVRFALVVKRLLVPDGAFVKEQLVCLRVPIARNLQRSRVIKVILNQVARAFRLGVLEVTIVARLITVVIKAGFVR